MVLAVLKEGGGVKLAGLQQVFDIAGESGGLKEDPQGYNPQRYFLKNWDKVLCPPCWLLTCHISDIALDWPFRG